MTDDTTPSGPQEAVDGPLRGEQPAAGPRVAEGRDDASDGRTASPEERAALTGDVIRCTCGCPESTHTGPGGHCIVACCIDEPCTPRSEWLRQVADEEHAERLARWRSAVRGAWDLDEQVADEIARAAIREADEEHAGIQLACAEEAARAKAHLEGVAAEADGWQRRYETAAAAVLAVRKLADDLAADHPAIARRITAALNQPKETR